jgi:uncharacterized protein (UPF0333 family)
MGSGRAQAGIEFTICIIFLIMIVTMLTIYSAGKQTEEYNVESKLESQKICWQISNLINAAMYARGYYAEFNLPIKINGENYNLSINNGTVVVDYRGSSCIYEITVTNISFRGQPAPFNLCGGDFYINNTPNGLVINNRSAVGCCVGC